jgi:hypothetical protein
MRNIQSFETDPIKKVLVVNVLIRYRVTTLNMKNHHVQSRLRKSKNVTVHPSSVPTFLRYSLFLFIVVYIVKVKNTESRSESNVEPATRLVNVQNIRQRHPVVRVIRVGTFLQCTKILAK